MAVALALFLGTSCSTREPAADAPGAEGVAGAGGAPNEPFSFFVTSLGAMRALASEFGAGEEGFGGDLRYGEETGLAGADKICATVAERGPAPT